MEDAQLTLSTIQGQGQRERKRKRRWQRLSRKENAAGANGGGAGGEGKGGLLQGLFGPKGGSALSITARQPEEDSSAGGSTSAPSPSFPLLVTEPTASVPTDWTLKASVRFESASDLQWTQRVPGAADGAFLRRHMLRGGRGGASDGFSLPEEIPSGGAERRRALAAAAEAFASATTFWAHPASALPSKWADHARRCGDLLSLEAWTEGAAASGAASSSGAFGGRRGGGSGLTRSDEPVAAFYRERLQQWSAAFCALFGAFQSESVASFVLQTPTVSSQSQRSRSNFDKGVRVLFHRRDGAAEAVLSSSTQPLRRELRRVGAKFEMPFRGKGGPPPVRRTAEFEPPLGGKGGPPAREAPPSSSPESAASGGLASSLVLRGDDACAALAEVLAEAVLRPKAKLPASSWLHFFDLFGSRDVPQLLCDAPFPGAAAKALQVRYCGLAQQSVSAKGAEGSAPPRKAPRTRALFGKRLERAVSLGAAEGTGVRAAGEAPPAEADDIGPGAPPAEAEGTGARTARTHRLELAGPVLPAALRRMAAAAAAAQAMGGGAAEGGPLLRVQLVTDGESAAFNGGIAMGTEEAPGFLRRLDYALEGGRLRLETLRDVAGGA